MLRNRSSRRKASVSADGIGGFSTKGMPITFKDLSYSVPSNLERGKEAFLLRNINGFFIPAEMAALMGPSGSGKTTLLDVLAGRKTQGTITGDIAFASHQPTQMFLRRYTGYVEQFDTLMSILTVREMMMYTAELKRPVWETLDSKKIEVERLISKLALDVCQDTRIGDQLSKGISGGQAKRVNIGISLVTDPRVLFLDEPTSGLDSYTANEVMAVVKGLVQDGVTICATIHSPSPIAFDLFDRLVLLLRGQLVFFGKKHEAVPYFESMALEDTSNISNEAEWLTDVIVNADRQQKASEFANQFAKSNLKRTMEAKLTMLSDEDIKVSPEILKELEVKRATVTPFWFALKTLIKYRTRKNFTDPLFLGSRIGDKLLSVFLIAMLFKGIGNDFSSDNQNNIAGLMFTWCTLPAFGSSACVPSIVEERALFYRERNDGLYRVITYLVAKIIDELFLAFFTSFFFGAIVYYVTNLQCDFVVFCMVYFGTLANSIVLAYLLSALAPNMSVANAAVPAYVAMLLFFTGLVIRLKDIPDYWFWYSKIDFMRYSWSALMVSQFRDENGESKTRVFREDGNSTGVLEYYSLEEKEEFYFGWIFTFFGAFFILAFLAMTFIKYQRR